MSVIVKFGILIFSISWIYFELKKWFDFRKKKYTTNESFRLTGSETKRLQGAEKKLLDVRNDLKQVEQQINDIELRGKNVRRNKKGDFDSRSALGKKLNREIRSARKKELWLQGTLQKAETEKEQLGLAGWYRAKPWLEAEARCIFARITILGYTASVLILDYGLLIMTGFWWGLLLIAIWIGLYFLTRKFLEDELLLARLEL
tara:strand:+ start:98 stop:706 length:609 start_codon:yes stop_codon:yes gene_type:complete